MVSNMLGVFALPHDDRGLYQEHDTGYRDLARR